MKVLLATQNPAKIAELKHGIALYSGDIECVTLADLQINNEPSETGKTFEENSLLKARYYAEKAHLPALADDGGIMIDILNGEPGIKSKRWLGRGATDSELIKHTLLRLNGVPLEKRTARLAACLTFFNPETNQVIQQQEAVEGYIALEPTKKIIPGFPYRSLFVVDAFDTYYDELTEDEHAKINHRLRAISELVPRITNIPEE
ncbi:non-canonical purine NTP pyrophosphatase [Candidatus Roizmanbacteria bacterium]|nr:non-canonical purine NTP pyrophosphatase [Candidatus Roizmanbacteria bacterium]